jgi:predicted anti-sigma-YlaC factor YlaD
MSCEEIKNIIPGDINHSISAEDTRVIEEHLCVCHSCRQFLSQLMEEDEAYIKPKTKKEEDFGTKKTAVRNEKVGLKIGSLEYVILGLGTGIVIFLVYFFLKK